MPWFAHFDDFGAATLFLVYVVVSVDVVVAHFDLNDNPVRQLKQISVNSELNHLYSEANKFFNLLH